MHDDNDSTAACGFTYSTPTSSRTVVRTSGTDLDDSGWIDSKLTASSSVAQPDPRMATAAAVAGALRRAVGRHEPGTITLTDWTVVNLQDWACAPFWSVYAPAASQRCARSKGERKRASAARRTLERLQARGYGQGRR